MFTTGTGDNKRKSHAEVQDKINGLYANAKLFDKGIKQFEGLYRFVVSSTELVKQFAYLGWLLWQFTVPPVCTQLGTISMALVSTLV